MIPTWLLSPTVWLAAAFAGMSLVAYVQTTRLGGCQGELNGAMAQLAVLSALLEQQNAAVSRLEAEGAKRQAEAELALQAARNAAAGSRAQAERLEALLAQRRKLGTAPVASACPAGDAVAEVRNLLSDSAVK